jgi:RHS repeat-associated protein
MVSSNMNGASVSYTYDAVNGLETVVDAALSPGTSTYTYDGNGNVTELLMANGVKSTYTYNTMQRPTGLTISKTSTTLASETNTFDPTGRQLSQLELSGRTVNYTYDTLYRLTSETIANDPSAINGSLNYSYDAAGNRLSRTSTLAALASTNLSYDANDRVTADAYDANGNTRNSGGVSYTYDFEDRLKTVNQGAVRYVYDGDGNRVAKTAGGVTTRYLVDDLNPTRYAQVIEELVDGNVQRVYTYGHKLLSQRQLQGAGWTTSFYGYDGQNNVRMLTDNTGVVTDNYTYDAFGTRTSSAGTTPNSYLYNGEQFDADLGQYYMRARNYAPGRGRFMTTDPEFGELTRPSTLHDYLYAGGDPVNSSDPTGRLEMVERAQIQVKIIDPTIPLLIALGIEIACIFNRAADMVMLKTEPVEGNPCAGKYPRCSKIHPEYVECDELGGNYMYPSAGAALAALKAMLGDKSLSLHNPDEATGGPCAGTPGAMHYNVRKGSQKVASIGECRCCEDFGGTAYPQLFTKCAIL